MSLIAWYKVYDFISTMYYTIHASPLTHPFGFFVSGGTKCGKTTFVKKFLSYVDVMIVMTIRLEDKIRNVRIRY